MRISDWSSDVCSSDLSSRSVGNCRRPSCSSWSTMPRRRSRARLELRRIGFSSIDTASLFLGAQFILSSLLGPGVRADKASFQGNRTQAYGNRRGAVRAKGGSDGVVMVGRGLIKKKKRDEDNKNIIKEN